MAERLNLTQEQVDAAFDGLVTKEGQRERDEIQKTREAFDAITHHGRGIEVYLHRKKPRGKTRKFPGAAILQNEFDYLTSQLTLAEQNIGQMSQQKLRRIGNAVGTIQEFDSPLSEVAREVIQERDLFLNCPPNRTIQKSGHPKRNR